MYQYHAKSFLSSKQDLKHVRAQYLSCKGFIITIACMEIQPVWHKKEQEKASSQNQHKYLIFM